MDRKKLGKRMVGLISFIFVVNVLTNLFHWDYSIWWWDMALHFLGGMWLALLMLWLLLWENAQKNLISQAILGVFIIGLGWEFYEYWINQWVAQGPFSFLDSISDLFFDLAGGLTVLSLYAKR